MIFVCNNYLRIIYVDLMLGSTLPLYQFLVSLQLLVLKFFYSIEARNFCQKFIFCFSCCLEIVEFQSYDVFYLFRRQRGTSAASCFSISRFDFDAKEIPLASALSVCHQAGQSFQQTVSGCLLYFNAL